MTLADLVPFVGSPVELEELKVRPGRRRTLRARGSITSVVVKLYESDRAPLVARRLRALAGGPAEPIVPRVIHVDAERHMLVLSDVPGRPLRELVTSDDLSACRRAGVALGHWHAAWTHKVPPAFADHTAEREQGILEERAAAASADVAAAVRAVAASLDAEWPCSTVVHRDLYEEQLLIGEQAGLIDLDDAAAGPAELDLGNLVAHLELLGLRQRLDVTMPTRALLEGYATTGRPLDTALLERCRVLSLLRLACLNDDLRLVDIALRGAVAG